MTTLEQQCEEIVELYINGDSSNWSNDAVKTLLDYIAELKSANQHLREGMETLAGKVVDLESQLAELRRPSDADSVLSMIVKDLSSLNNPWRDVDVDDRNALTGKWRKLLPATPRPSDAKEIAQIQERYAQRVSWDPSIMGASIAKDLHDDIGVLLRALAESQRLLKTSEDLRVKYHSAWVTEREANENLRYKLEDSQRECARLQAESQQYKEWCRVWRTCLETAGTCTEVGSTIDPTNIAAAIRDKFSELQAQIARLSSPPEERGDIAEYLYGRRCVFKPMPLPQELLYLETLLGDCAAWRNAHSLVTAERDAARAKSAELDQHCSGVDDENIKLLERIEQLERNNSDMRVLLGQISAEWGASEIGQIDGELVDRANKLYQDPPAAAGQREIQQEEAARANQRT